MVSIQKKFIKRDAAQKYFTLDDKPWIFNQKSDKSISFLV
jgi:hypothetical protein